MHVGMTLPVMEPDLWASADTLEAWSRAIDDGPFSSLCFGERMAFDNPDTPDPARRDRRVDSRVRLVTTVVVPQLHAPVPLAKALATGDRLSGGRLTVGPRRRRPGRGLPGGRRRPGHARRSPGWPTGSR